MIALALASATAAPAQAQPAERTAVACRRPAPTGVVPVAVDAATLERIVSADDGCWKVVNFWATWCAPCRVEVPHLAALQSDRRFRRLRIITVNMDRPALRPAAAKLLARARAGKTGNYQLLPPDFDAVREIVGGRWTVALPLTLITGPDGRRVRRHDGQLSIDRLAAYLLRQGS